ncbi:MAG: hypothetical protein JWQ35_2534 [Bacteriovoracaceae bacterium]|nr:hypothetical protein [Bacteriovoracaceae bacterium]
MIQPAKNMNEGKRMKIEEALRVLEDATTEAKQDVVELIQEKYHNVKSAFKEIINDVNLGEVANDVREQGRRVFNDSQKKIKLVSQKVDSSVHDNPWIYVGASAVVGLTLGFLLTRKK